MAEQLTIGQLIAALDEIPGNPLVRIAGFGGADVPGDLCRHRSHIADLAIEVTYQRVNWITVERFKMMLLQHATQPVTKFNPNPTTLDSPAWVRPGMETTQSFHAVTGVDFFEDHAVIRSEDVAPVQGPSIQRVSDEEMLRRNFELTGTPVEAINLDTENTVNRWLIRAIPKERASARVRLETARADLEKLLAEIPRLEAENTRYDYVLGITDTLPDSARPNKERP
jgi:hypothetical protein